MQDHPDALVKEKEGISAVWLIPAIALIFGIWLMVKTIVEQGFYITVQFENATGMVEGKTEVRYKGLPVGKVVGIDVSDDLKHVDVEIEMVAATKPLLTDKTKFWFVTADVSFQGISGLDTLFSGGYISVQPDLKNQGESTRQFVALSDAPIIDKTTPGLHISLQTDTLGSLDKNSPVNFKQINVGHVSGYRFDENTGKVNVMVFIKPEFAHLVKQNSIFWNSSGFEMTGSLATGLKVKTDSLGAIMSGGIAFDDPKFESALPAAESGATYKLHPDFQTAEMGHEITLNLDWDAGIDKGSLIEYQGLTLGVIDAIDKIDPQKRKVTAVAMVNPRVIPYLTSDSQFFVVAAQLDLGGVTNLNTLLKGPHISLRPSLTGEPRSVFNVFSQKPAYDYSEPGLHLILKASNIESIKVGTGIFYKKQRVGSVQAIEDKASNEVLVHIHIESKYQDYIDQGTRFWNNSGIKFSGNLQGFKFDANSIQSILAGGIEFDVDNNSSEAKANNGDVYSLFNTHDEASQKVAATLIAKKVSGIKASSRLIYRGEHVGSVHNITHRNDNHFIQVGLLPEFEYLLKENSLFWLAEPQVSFAGLKDTDALFGGSYIAISAGSGEYKNQFPLLLNAPAKHISHEGLQLKVTAEQGNIVDAGSPVLYKGVLVGQVDSVAFDQQKQQVDINMTIDEQYRHFVTPHSRFYNASGLSISGSLGNLRINTASADALLQGGISFYNPDDIEVTKPIDEGASFTLFSNGDHAQLAGMSIEIYFKNTKGLHDNLKIKYQDQVIGLISHIVYDQQGFGATAFGYLSDTAQKFARQNSDFWLAKPVLGLVGNKDLDAIVEGGYIAVQPGNGQPSSRFVAQTVAPAIKTLPYGLNIELTASSLGSVRVGNPVLYKQVPVGEVIGVGLTNSADQVVIYVNIADKFAPLVTAQSQFWNTSGFQLEAGLFSGINIESESMESLLSGGIAFATPETTETQTVVQGQRFNLNAKPQKAWHNWSPVISLKQ